MRNSHFTRVSVAALFGIITVAACGGGSTATHQLDLSLASSQASYTAGTPVVLTVTLTNRGTETIQVSTLLESNVRIVSLTRDGAEVIQDEWELDTDVDLRTLATDRLADLAPGASITLTWTADDEGPQETLALFWAAVDADGNVLGRHAPVFEPGHYTLSAVYRFSGVAGTGIFTDSSSVGQVSFDITP